MPAARSGAQSGTQGGSREAAGCSVCGRRGRATGRTVGAALVQRQALDSAGRHAVGMQACLEEALGLRQRDVLLTVDDPSPPAGAGQALSQRGRRRGREPGAIGGAGVGVGAGGCWARSALRAMDARARVRLHMGDLATAAGGGASRAARVGRLPSGRPSTLDAHAAAEPQPWRRAHPSKGPQGG